MKIFFSYFVLVLIWGCQVHAQSSAGKVWTLQECIEQATKNNLQIKQSLLNAELNNQQLILAKGNVLPTLNGSFNHTYNSGRRIDPFTNQFATDWVLSQNLYLASSLNLFSGLQNYYSIKAAQLMTEAGKYDVEKMKNDISLAVVTAYLQVLFSQETIENNKNQVELTKQQVERTKQLVASGTLARGALLQVEAQMANEEVALVTAQTQLNIALLTLAQFMEIDPAEVASVEKPAMDMSAESLLDRTPAEIAKQASASLPEIKSAALKMQSMDKSLSVAKGRLFPILSLNAAYGTGYSGLSKNVTGTVFSGSQVIGATNGGELVYSPVYTLITQNKSFTDQYRDNINKSVGLSLQLPLFNGFQTKVGISRAKVNVELARTDFELANNQLRKNVQQAYADAKGGFNKYQAAVKSREAMQQSFKDTEQRFNVGLVNALEYSEAKTKLSKAESDVLQAKYEYVFKSKVLDFYQGKPLTF